MDIISTILIALIITLLSLVLLVPVAWRMAKILAKVTESVAIFVYKLRKAVVTMFGAFKKQPEISEENKQAFDEFFDEWSTEIHASAEALKKENPELDNRIMEMRQMNRRQQDMLSAKHNIPAPMRAKPPRLGGAPRHEKF